MELKQSLQVIRKYLAVLVVLIALGAIFGFYSTKFFSSGYHHSQTYFLADPSVDVEISENFKSENFLTQEKARNFTDTAIAILDSSDFKNEILIAGDTLLVRKVAPQVIRLTHVSSRADTSNSQLQNITKNFNSKIQALTESTQASQLKALGHPQPPSYSSLNGFILAVAGAFLGGLFALFVIGLKNYLDI